MTEDCWEIDVKGYFSYNAETRTFYGEGSDLDMPIDIYDWPDTLALRGIRETVRFKMTTFNQDRAIYHNIDRNMKVEVLND